MCNFLQLVKNIDDIPVIWAGFRSAEKSDTEHSGGFQIC
jgi:hypothetical protein